MTDKTKDQTADVGDEASAPGAGKKPAPAGGGAKPETAEQDNAATEIGGRGGPDPTRFGDWEINGRCVDF